MQPTEYLFVYGTLRRAGGAGGAGRSGRMRRLLEQQAQLVGRGSVPGRIYDLGRYPGLVDATGGRVTGELYRLRRPGPMLARLDRHERCDPTYRNPTEYRRTAVPVRLRDGSVVTAWVYHYNWSVRRARRLRSGDWLRR